MAQDKPEDGDTELIRKFRQMNFFKRYILEIVTAFFAFAYTLSELPQQDMYMDKSCRLHLFYNATVCQHLHDEANKAAKAQVQITTKLYETWSSIILGVPVVIVAIMAGQYMSRYGLRKPLIMVVAGATLSSLYQLYVFNDPSLNLNYCIFSVLPEGVTGGYTVMKTAVFTHISLTCSPDERKGRFLILQFFTFLPVVVSTAVGQLIYLQHGIVPLYGALVIAYLVALVLLYLFYDHVEVNPEAKNDTLMDVLKHSTSLDTLKESFIVVGKSRPKMARLQLLCMIVCATLGAIGLLAGNLEYFYMNYVFNWGIKQFSDAKVISMLIVYTMSYPVMLVFTKKLNFGNPMLCAIGYFSYAARFAVASLMFLGPAFLYIQTFIGIPFMVGLTALRSHIGQLVKPHETSMVFSLISCLERVFPMLEGLLLTLIYNATLSTFPGAVFIFLCFTYLITTGLSIVCVGITKRLGYPNYTDDAEHVTEMTEVQKAKE